MLPTRFVVIPHSVLFGGFLTYWLSWNTFKNIKSFFRFGVLFCRTHIYFTTLVDTTFFFFSTAVVRKQYKRLTLNIKVQWSIWCRLGDNGVVNNNTFLLIYTVITMLMKHRLVLHQQVDRCLFFKLMWIRSPITWKRINQNSPEEDKNQ